MATRKAAPQSNGSGRLSYPALAKCAEPATAFLTGPEPQLEWSLGEVIPDPVLAMIYANRATGKSWAALDLAVALAANGQWLGRPEFQAVRNGPESEVGPRKVLYVDGELPEQELKLRLRQLCRGQEAPARLTILSAVEIGLNLADPAHQQHVERLLKTYDVLIFDHWSALVLGQNVSSNDDLEAINPWLMKLRADNLSVIYTHHENRSGHQLGAGGREFPLDVVLHLIDTKTSAGQPARFKLKLEKSRRMVDWPEVEVELQPDGRWTAPGAGGIGWTKRHWDVLTALAEGRSPETVAKNPLKGKILAALAEIGWIEKAGEGRTAPWRISELGATERTKRTNPEQKPNGSNGLHLVQDVH